MKTKFALYLATFCLIASLAANGAHAATITVLNNDGAGEGFNDPTGAAPVGGNYGTTIGAQRLIAFQYAAGIWAACLQSNVPIIVQAQMDPLACNAGSAVLGSAGATFVFRDFAGAPLAGTWYPEALANALHGSDLDAGSPDINATFNSNLGQPGCLTGVFFYYGLDGLAPGGTIDFVSVVVHEIGHGLGFQTFMSQAGVRLGGFNDDYMVFLENHGAVPPGYPAMTDAQRAAGNIADPNLHWTGPLVTAQGTAILSAGMSGGHVRMHGPNPYQPGSSVSHWSTALFPNELMEPVYTGPNHDPGLAWTLMDEIGWTLVNKVTDGCDGAIVNLAAPTGSTANYPDDSQERGAYVTSLKDFTLCSIGWEADLVPGETITARVYAATGVTRGALLAIGSATVEFAGMRTHYVPISYTLQDCKEYDITVQFNHTVSWPAWNENTMTQRPFDVDGVIRVRDGEYAGGAGNFLLPHYTLQGSAPSPQNLSNLTNSGTCINYPNEHGAWVTAKKTQSICSLGVGVNITTAPTTVRAYVYNSAANVRGALVAEGAVSVGAIGFQTVNVPVNAVLKEGQQYDIGFVFGAVASLNRSCHQEAFPWQFGDLLRFDSQETNGVLDNGNNTVPTFQIAWDEGSGGELLDLVGPWHNGTPDSPNLTQDNFDYGLYVTATKNSEVYSVGWFADVAPGQVIGANVYAAAGNLRGALISSGTLLSGASGKRWHDIPLSASLVSGQDYDVEIDIGQVDSWDCWNDHGDGSGPPLPYNAYGILNIREGESGGNATNYCIIDIRLGACATTVTGVHGRPGATPKFTLTEAFPNPFSGSTKLGYELDRASKVSVAVYDVAGRKVADVLQSRSLPAGPGQLSFDAGKLASGVYFVKLSTPSQSVTRKITIVR
jgi:hypothetical protein